MEQIPSNLNSTGLNKTTNFFNNYFQQPDQLDQNINDSILSYFEQQMEDKESARLMVQTIIETAKANRQSPLDVLSEFQKFPSGELTARLVIYLNGTRVNTSFLGIKSTPKTNPFVQRSIIS
jgi:hypothetical protein